MAQPTGKMAQSTGKADLVFLPYLWGYVLILDRPCVIITAGGKMALLCQIQHSVPTPVTVPASTTYGHIIDLFVPFLGDLCLFRITV
jgi:hypothetical protein